MPAPTLRDMHIDSAMTEISIAYRNRNYIAPQVFPIVPVEKKSDYYFVFGRGDWFRDDVEVRAPGARARRVDYTLSSASYVCITYALSKGVTDEERENADAPLRPDTQASEFVTDMLQRAMERRVASMITTCANWASASTPSTVWSNPASDILADIENARNAIISSIGVEPNLALMSQDVWRYVKNHPDLLDRIKYTQRGVMTKDLFAGLIEVDKFLVGTALYNSAKEGATDSMAYIWGNCFWLGYVPPRAALMEPAAGYVLQWGANVANRYREDQEHQDVIEVQQSMDEVITGSDAGAGYYGVV